MEKKLRISQNSFFYTYKNNFNLITIVDLIKNTFLNYNIYVSNIYVYEYPKSIIIKYNIWIHNKNCYIFLNNIINFLKSLLVLKYNKNIEFNIKMSKDIFNDDKLITNYLHYEMNSNKQLLKILKDIKKNVNKSKNNR